MASTVGCNMSTKSNISAVQGNELAYDDTLLNKLESVPAKEQVFLLVVAFHVLPLRGHQFNVRTRGLNSALFWLAQMVAAWLFGTVQDCFQTLSADSTKPIAATCAPGGHHSRIHDTMDEGRLVRSSRKVLDGGGPPRHRAAKGLLLVALGPSRQV
eukprot:6318162-Amphidinium_carterae.1